MVLPNMNDFWTDQFDPKMDPLTGITTPSQSGYRSNCNEAVFYTFQISRNGASPLDVV